MSVIGQGPMNSVRVPILFLVIGLLLVIGGFGVYTVLNPPYTDQEILNSGVVDAWEPEAIVTFALLFVLAVIGVFCIALTYRSNRLTRRLAALAVFLCVFSGALFLSSHAALTERTTRLTGQTFGPLYGLF